MNHMQFVVNDDRVEAVRRVLTILEQCLPIYDPRGFGGQLLPDERTLTRIRRLRARLHGCGEHVEGS